MSLQSPCTHARRRGFTLIELMIVIAVIAVVSAIAIPQLQAARVTANESKAISMLRSLATAQAQVSSSAGIDTDSDGRGEYAYFGELAGIQPARVDSGAGPGPGAVGVDELTPTLLTAALGNVNGGIVTVSGYSYRIWLPGPTVGVAVPAIAEDANGGKVAGPFPDPDNGESYWCAYAWPVSLGETGRSVYFVSNDGTLLTYRNMGGVVYEGLAGGPGFDAAYSVPGDMSAAIALGGAPGADGNVWVVLN